MDSNHNEANLELLAALIDGRLSGEERARAMKLLAESEESLELFASVVREEPRVENKVENTQVVPIAAARSWRRWSVLVPVAAAAVLALVLVPRFTGRDRDVVSGNRYAMEVTRDPRFADALREGWEQRGWTVTRGGGGAPEVAVGSAAESKLAFRLGVRSVHLQVALLRPDTALANRLTTEILATLNAVQYSDVAAEQYAQLKSQLATGPISQSIELASDAEQELRGMFKTPSSSSSFEFGEWVSAAEFAAMARDASFFTSTLGTSFIRSSLSEGSLSADDTKALDAIDSSLTQGSSDRVLDDVRATLQSVIKVRGG